MLSGYQKIFPGLNNLRAELVYCLIFLHTTDRRHNRRELGNPRQERSSSTEGCRLAVCRLPWNWTAATIQDTETWCLARIATGLASNRLIRRGLAVSEVHISSFLRNLTLAHADPWTRNTLRDCEKISRSRLGKVQLGRDFGSLGPRASVSDGSMYEVLHLSFAPLYDSIPCLM